MGCFHADIIVLNVKDESRNAAVQHLQVDTGAESSWIPRAVLESMGVERRKKDQSFQMANGQIIMRGVGYAVIRSGGYETVDEVVFAEADDLPLLGARTLEGFNVRVEPGEQKIGRGGSDPGGGKH